VVLGAIGGFLGVAVAFIANTFTTPISDPRLATGTLVNVTDATTGRIIDQQRLTAGNKQV
jgi:hypothetical protein